MIGKTYDQIEMGEVAEFSKTFSEADIYLYAGISGDFNPAHINEAFASQTYFKTRIAHGMLSAGLIPDPDFSKASTNTITTTHREMILTFY